MFSIHAYGGAAAKLGVVSKNGGDALSAAQLV